MHGIEHTSHTHTQSCVLVCLSSIFKQKDLLPGNVMSLRPETVLSSTASIQQFLEKRFKTSDELRHLQNNESLSHKGSAQLGISILDHYDHSIIIVNRLGRLIFKNRSAIHLFKGIYFPRHVGDLLNLGRFYTSIAGQDHLIPVKDLLKKQIFPKLFKGDEEYLVSIHSLKYMLHGKCYLMVFKNRGKFEIAHNTTFFLDSSVVIQSLFHELGSPVTSIGLGLELLEDQDLSGELKEDLKYCWDAYHRLKTLTADLPQFFSWEDRGFKPRKINIKRLADDLFVVLNLQLKLNLKNKTQKQLPLIRLKKGSNILCVKSALFHAYQELIHFLMAFCKVDPSHTRMEWHPFVKGNKFYLELILKSSTPFPPLQQFSRSFSESDHEAIHDQSLGLREGIRHAYLMKISSLFQAAGFRLWIFSKADEIQFRVEFIDLLMAPERTSNKPINS
jgi:hypothetical protein